MTATQREQIQAVEMKHTAFLHVENHANTDYPDTRPRSTRIDCMPCASFVEAVEIARHIHSTKVRGENFICDLTVIDGPRMGCYHVSQNGRVWMGCARDWSAETVEVKI